MSCSVFFSVCLIVPRLFFELQIREALKHPPDIAHETFKLGACDLQFFVNDAKHLLIIICLLELVALDVLYNKFGKVRVPATLVQKSNKLIKTIANNLRFSHVLL